LNSYNVSSDLDDFRRFSILSLFRLRLYRSIEDNKQIYCVALLVRCEEPQGWIAIWRRCYDSLEKASELYNAVAPLAKNRLRDLLLVEIEQQTPMD
jgi:hypothetical protein